MLNLINKNTVRYTYEPTEKELVLKFELAGKTKDNIKLSRKQDSLNLTVDSKNTYHIDLTSDYYDLDEYSFENIEASMKHGLLTVTIPRMNEQLYEIPIKATC
jgi:HSP20 family molecular chaperone IbpA